MLPLRGKKSPEIEHFLPFGRRLTVIFCRKYMQKFSISEDDDPPRLPKVLSIFKMPQKHHH